MLNVLVAKRMALFCNLGQINWNGTEKSCEVPGSDPMGCNNLLNRQLLSALKFIDSQSSKGVEPFIDSQS